MSDTLVRMPKLADTLVEGTLGTWLKNVGDTVEQGEALASIETDKVTTEFPSPAAGTLIEVLVGEGQTVPVETPIARIGAAADAVSSDSPSAPPDHSTARKPTPVAARLLVEHGLAAEQIPSTAARVTKDDVLNFVRARGKGAPPTPAHAAVTPSTGELVPLTSMRRAIAEHMLKARQTIPQGQTVMAADLTRLVEWRDAHKAEFQQREGASLTFTVLFVHAMARQLEPDANLGVAVALEAGLVVPVLRRAGSLTLGEIARGIADLAARARAGKLAPDEIQAAYMTVTNVGSFGNLTAAPIVPLGQVGILGPGVVERRPLPGPDHGLRLGWRCLLCLMFDRRELTDFDADRLLRSIVQTLEQPPD
jgi:2-oxoisovalerate dehydrogenase E2 component (dihydrolipoyl transacylase)